jgi:4-amino-4-deoxy-L-arabinose transferase-like glycosyltransferase
MREHRTLILFAFLLLVLLPARGLWAPDEPDFAQCVKEMRQRGTWVLPYLNGLPYSEKPILFYWLMKASAVAGEWLVNGRGFMYGISAWALRVPSVAAAILFGFGFQHWIKRFQGTDSLELSSMLLFTTPIWVWQAQTIQIDMLFAALLAWSWLSWVGGYLLATGRLAQTDPTEARRWLLGAYVALGLAFLAKGPLAVVLSGLVAVAFLAWQRDWKGLARVRLGSGLCIMTVIVLPWYLAARLAGGSVYFHELVIVQNFERATHAWDHIQPRWRYFEYILGDFWPWVLFLPGLGIHLVRSRRSLTPLQRFQILAFLVPFLFLSWAQSKQGKYLLMSYPFLALLTPNLFLRRDHEQKLPLPKSWLGWVLSAAMGLLAVAMLALSFTHLGGRKLHAQILPYLGPLRAGALIAVAGALLVVWRARKENAQALIRDAALTLGALYLVVGAWGFRLLDSTKEYHRWTALVEPQIAGRRVFFWQTIRSGAMIYTDHLMPELRTLADLEATLGPEDRLVSQDREWNQDSWGMTPEARMRFEVLLRVQTGAGEMLLIRKRPQAMGAALP